MKLRILGEEIEWSAAKKIPLGNGKYRLAEFPAHQISSIFYYILAKRYPLQNQNDPFMPNGGFFHNETTGGHIETATPECAGLQEITAHSKASELIVGDLARDIVLDHDEQTVFHKKNTDFRITSFFAPGAGFSSSPGATRACHENYSVDPNLGKNIALLQLARIEISKGLANVAPEIMHLLLFLTTRQIISGSGGIKMWHYDPCFYMISPRAYHIGKNIASSTTNDRERSIICYGREALADERICGRFHVICGDANMSEASIYLKYGTTCAVLEMIEADAWDRNLICESSSNEAKLFREISRDLTCLGVGIKLADGATKSALEIQKLFHQRFAEYVKANNLSPEHFELAERWGEALECLARDDAKVYRLLDWKIKEKLVRDYCQRKSFGLTHPKVLLLDLEYHGVHPEKGVYNKLKNDGRVERILSNGQIEEAVAAPPPKTRANARRKLVDILDRLRIRYSIYWTGAIPTIPSDWEEFPQDRSCSIEMHNPFNCDLDLLDDFESKRLVGLLKARAGRTPPH